MRPASLARLVYSYPGPQARWYALLIALVWVYVLLIVIASAAAPLGDFDDAIPLLHGSLVQQREVPAVDFRSFYPPLGPYITAAAFGLFGRTVIATRLVAGLLYIFVLLLLDQLLSRRFVRYSARYALTFFLLAATLGKTVSLAAWPGFGFATVALMVYLLSYRAGRFEGWVVVTSGVLTGLAMLYRVNFGGYVAFLIGVDLLMEYRTDLRQLLPAAARFYVPMAASITLLCLAIYGRHSLSAIAEFTVTSQRVMMQRGFEDLHWHKRLVGALLVPYFWLSLRVVCGSGTLNWRALVPAATGMAAVALALRFGDMPAIVAIGVLFWLGTVLLLDWLLVRITRLERAFLLFYILLLHYYLSRADSFHWKFLPFASMMLLPFVFPEPVETRRPLMWVMSRSMALASVVLLCGVLMWPDSTMALSSVRHGMSAIAASLEKPVTDADRLVEPEPSPDVDWSFLYSTSDELQVVRHMRQVTKATDPVFVGVPDHSRVYFSNLRLYWLIGRPIGVRQFQLEDQFTTEPEVQREIIADLERNQVNWVVIDRRIIDVDDRFLRRAYSGSKLLDGYLAEHFQEESRFGLYLVLKRAQ